MTRSKAFLVGDISQKLLQLLLTMVTALSIFVASAGAYCSLSVAQLLALVRSDVTMKVIEERWADDIAERVRVSKRVISLCRMHENYSEFLPCKWAEEIVVESQTGFRGAFMGPESNSDGTNLLDNVPDDIMTEWYNGIVLPVRRRDASTQFSEDILLMRLLNGSVYEECSCLFSVQTQSVSRTE